MVPGRSSSPGVAANGAAEQTDPRNREQGQGCEDQAVSGPCFSASSQVAAPLQNATKCQVLSDGNTGCASPIAVCKSRDHFAFRSAERRRWHLTKNKDKTALNKRWRELYRASFYFF